MNNIHLKYLFLIISICFLISVNAQTPNANITYDIDSVYFTEDSIKFDLSIHNQPMSSGYLKNQPKFDFSIALGEGKNIDLNNNNFSQPIIGNGFVKYKTGTSYQKIYSVPSKSRLIVNGFTVKRNGNPLEFKNYFNVKGQLMTINSDLDDHVYLSSIKKVFSNNINQELQKGIVNPSISTQKEITKKFAGNISDYFSELTPEVQIKIIKYLTSEFRDTILSQIDNDSTYTPIIINRFCELFPLYSFELLFKKLNKKEPASNIAEIWEIELLANSIGKYCNNYPVEVYSTLNYYLSDSIKKHIAENYFKLNKEQIHLLFDSINIESIKTLAFRYFETNQGDIADLMKYANDSIKKLISLDFILKNKDIISDLVNNLNTRDYNKYIVPDLITIENGSFSYQLEQSRTKDPSYKPLQQQNTANISFVKDSLQPVTYNFINSDKDPKKYKSITKVISPYKKNEIDMGINVDLNVDSISDKLSHRINYFNMDKYYGVGGTFYGPFYGNQFTFSFITRIDSGYPLQPLVVGNIETYWTNGVNGDFGILLNKLSEKGFLQTCNAGIYTGAEFINNSKFFKDTLSDTYYDWEIGLSGSKRFKIDKDSKTWQEINLRIPVTYRYLLGKLDKHHTFFSPQVTLSYNWDRVFIQAGCQFHLLGNNTLPISNGGVWLKVYYKLNRD